MNDTIKSKCDLMVQNREIVKKASWGEYGLTRSASAAVGACAGRTLDEARIKECNKILKKRKGIFSSFRGYSKLLITTKMSLADDPADYLDKAIEIYDKLLKGKIFSSEHHALAALSIVDTGMYDRADAIVEKSRSLFSAMQSKHPFLTSAEDTALVTLMAMTDKSTDSILSEVETAFECLKDKFKFHANAVYGLSQVLVIQNGDIRANCQKAITLYDQMRKRGIKYGKEYELPSLGTLINLDISNDEVISNIADISNYLKKQKGFSSLHMDKQMRMMFGSMLLANTYTSAESAQMSATIAGAISTAIVEEIAMMITIMIICSSTSAASSSSN